MVTRLLPKANFWLIVITLLVIVVGAQASALLGDFATGDIDTDTHLLYDASREVAVNGLPRQYFFINSTPGFDVFLWSHQLMPYWYGAWYELVPYSIFEFNYLLIFDLLVVMAVTGLLLWRLFGHTRWWAFVWVLVAYDALFIFVLAGERMFIRWSYVWAVLALLVLFKIDKVKSQRRGVWLAGLVGVLVAASVLSFVSIGVPIAAGLIVVSIVWWWRKKRYISAMFLGGIVTAAIAYGYALYQLGFLAWSSLIRLVFSYGSGVVASGQHPWWLQTGQFVSWLVVPPRVSLLPVGIVVTFWLWRQRFALTSEERKKLRLAVLLIVVWLVLAVFGSAHFGAHLLVWVLPLVLGCTVWALTDVRYKNARVWLLGWIVLLLAGQLIYQYWARRWDLIGLAGTAGVLYGASVWWWLQRNREWVQRARSSIAVSWLVLFALLFSFFPSVVVQLSTLKRNIPAVLSAYARSSPPSDVYVEAVQQVVLGEVGDKGTVLTNIPLADFFPSVEFYYLYHYRGILSGATEQPAEIAVLFGDQDQRRTADYLDVGVDDVIAFRGWRYRVYAFEELPLGKRVFFGEPVTEYDSKTVKWPRVVTDDDETFAYIEWRRSQNLPLR